MKLLFIRLLGCVILLYVGYIVLVKQIIMPIIGVNTEGVIIGYKGKQAKAPIERSYSKNLWDARTAYVKFLPKNTTDSLTVLSDGNAFFSFLNYSKNDKVHVSYWANRPQSATIINWREYPLPLFIGFIGAILLLGKPPRNN